jgi:SNF2 family DNA or RNA helicase
MGTDLILSNVAHIIRNRATKRFRAIHALQARFRWCLTGTPIFNRIEDLGSLMGFLGAHPFDSSSSFNSRISNSVLKGTPNGLETLRKLVHATCLRRTKDSIHDELRLPSRTILDEAVQWTQQERSDCDVLKSRYASILHEDDGINVSRRFTASIMRTIARLRQFCDHGLDLLPRKVHQLYDRFTTADKFSCNIFDALEACAVCQIQIDIDSQNQNSLDCGHYLCSRCQKKTSDEETLIEIVCKIFDQDTAKSGSSSPHPSMQLAAATSGSVPSSKVQKLLQNLISERQSSSYQPVKRCSIIPDLLSHLIRSQF